MTHLLPTQAARRLSGNGFWRKTWAMLVKEFIQLRRDRVSFAMIIIIPLVQLTLFGYINTTPRDLPTAVLLQENTDLSRSILAALQNTKYFKVTQLPRGETEVDQLLASEPLFAVEIPANFERSVRRGDKPAMLVVANVTDPSPPAPHSARLAKCCRPRFRTTAMYPTVQSCRSRSASTRATIRPA